MIEKILSHKILVIMLSFFCVSAISGYLIHNYLFNTNNNSDKSAVVAEKEAENKTINFLILGVDTRDDDVGRSDTILVLSTNLATKKFGLISIPRDSRVEVLGHGETKINHSYAYGGVNLTKQTVEKTLNIKIDNYLVFDFATFKNAINKLGGIDINVEKDMYYRDDYDGENGLLIDLKAGQQHLDGEKAMEYVRYRDEEGDIGRVHRQQNFLNAIIKKITSPETFIKLPSLIREVFGSIKTDITFDGLTNYISFIKPNQGYQIKAMMIPGKPEEIEDLSYWIIDYSELKKQLTDLNNFITDKVENNLIADTTPYTQEEKDEGIFKNNDKISNPLDWEIEQLSKANKNKNIKNKLLQEEEEERQTTRYNRQYYPDYQQSYEPVNTNGIRIINTTTDTNKTDIAVSALEDNGIDVGIINNKQSGKSSNDRTIFIVSSKDNKITSILKNLPFKYTIIYKDTSAKSTLIIGENFYK